jgi:hypothetical protein
MSPRELETKLTHFAARQGRNPDEPVKDVLTRYFEEGGNGASPENGRRPYRGDAGLAL